MSQSDDREEGDPPSKTIPCEEAEAHRMQQQRPDSPELTFVSMSSEQAEDPPGMFKGGQSADGRMQQQRRDSPESSCVSMSSERSKDPPAVSKGGQTACRRLPFCNLSGGNCRTPSSGQIEPNLRDNKLNVGVKHQSAGWMSPYCTLGPLRMDRGGGGLQQTLRFSLRKYACKVELDPNTVNSFLELSNNNRVATRVKEDRSYPDHPDRFDFWPQLLCTTGLTGRCYWELEWRGRVDISVAYRGMRRRGNGSDCVFGGNDQSWSLSCSVHGYSVWHNKRETSITSSSSSSSSLVSNRVAVYVDCPAGSLSFYRVLPYLLIHLHTFNTTFTEPLYPGFRLWLPGSSVSLCSEG